MKKYIIAILTGLMILFGSVQTVFAASNFYGGIALTGGTSGSLDSIDGTSLATGDAAYVITSTAYYIYYLNATSGAGESSPDIISPDDNAGDKRWILIFQGDPVTAEIAQLAVTDSNIIVGNGTTWVAESGATARTSLGVTIGTNVQAWDNDLDDIAALTPTDSYFMVGDNTDWVTESDATARTSLGLGTGDSPSFTAVDVGASILATRSLTVDTGGVFNIDLGGAAGDDFTVDTTTFNISSDLNAVGVGVVPTARNNTVLQIKDGIGFPASAVASSDPNTLDHYEEGYYTQTIVCSISGSYTVNAANDQVAYTKIGREVTVQGYLTVSGESSPVGSMRFSLPFACSQLNDTSERTIGVFVIDSSGYAIPVVASVTGQASYFQLVAQNDTVHSVDNNDVDAAWNYTFSLTYIAVNP